MTDWADEKVAELLPCIQKGWACDDGVKTHLPNCAVNYRPAVAEALRANRREVLEEAANIAEQVRDGYTANVVTSESEPELIRDIDGPWVLNTSVAAAIRALAAKEQ